MTVTSAAVADASPVLQFGVEKEVEYAGHLTLAAHLLVLPRRLFASADDTHIRVWDSSGRDVAKTCFPGHRRAMVAAMGYCHTHSVIVTAEMDMSVKVYVAETLEMIENFSLEQARRRGQVRGSGSWGKATALEVVHSGGQDYILLGGDGGLELWSLQRTNSVRSTAVVQSNVRLEYHLRLEVLRRLSTSAVLGIQNSPSEHRVTVWGPDLVCVYDSEDMSQVTSFQRPHGGEAVRCACIQIISILDTALLTGGEDGKVNFWMIRSRQMLEEGSATTFRKDATMGLEFCLPGHSRPVELVNFYSRLQPDSPQKYCISFGRDGKIKVWSLSFFSLIYSLDVPLLDPRSVVFSLGRAHLFGVCSVQAPSSSAVGGPKTNLTIARFTAHIAAPFATTNASPVRRIAQAPSKPVETQQALSDAVVLVSDDMAVHIVDSEGRRVIATLPPPPNSQVQILRTFLCPPWQLLLLWLSTQEIAVFFIPRPKVSDKAGERIPSKTQGPSSPQLVSTSGSKRATEAATPLLVRRFSIFEVNTGQVSASFWKESFQCVSLHYGVTPPKTDQMAQRIFQAEEQEELSTARTAADWFLVIGTRQGTVHAYLLRDILNCTPLWESIAKHLPSGAWRSTRKRTFDSSHGLSGETTEEVTQALLAASADCRVPGQRPFPKEAPMLRLWLRWKCHDYLVAKIETTAQHVFTLDMRHDLRLWQLVDMQCILHCKVGDFECYAPFARNPVTVTPALSLHQVHRRLSGVPQAGNGNGAGLAARTQVLTQPELSGIVLGMSTGGVRLMVKEPTGTGVRVSQSSALHAAPVQQVDCLHGLCVVVSIAEDNTVKIWSETLMHLRDVVFPQPLTAVSFLRRQDLDGMRGHGDVLIGFAGAVKVVHLEQWARAKLRPAEDGAAEEATKPCDESSIDSTTDNGSVASDSEDTCIRSQQDLRAYIQRKSSSDDIADYMQALGDVSSKPATRAPTRLRATPARSTPRPGASSVGDNSRMESERCAVEGPPEVAEGKTKASAVVSVKDFRGPPLREVNTLGVSVHPARDDHEFSPHARIHVLDQGQVSVVSHFQPVYFDDVISPNDHVTAPREVAIRGTVDRYDVAIVTSIGTGHLRDIYSTGLAAGSPSDDEGGCGQPNEPDIREVQEELARRQSPPRSRTRQVSPTPQDALDAARKRGQSEAHDRRVSTPRLLSSRRPSQDRFAQPGMLPHSARQSRPLARGVPTMPSPPHEQDISHTALETAKMMATRLDVDEVLDAPDQNALRAAVSKRSTNVYVPHNSEAAMRNRVESQKKQWTNTGRLICGARPPTLSIPLKEVRGPRSYQDRPPQTRAEFTEQRIIREAAQADLAPPIDLSMEVCESFQLKPRAQPQHSSGIVQQETADYNVASPPGAAGEFHRPAFAVLKHSRSTDGSPTQRGPRTLVMEHGQRHTSSPQPTDAGP